MNCTIVHNNDDFSSELIEAMRPEKNAKGTQACRNCTILHNEAVVPEI